MSWNDVIFCITVKHLVIAILILGILVLWRMWRRRA